MKKQNGYDALVVGGGAAGMMAALSSAQSGKRTLLLEANAQLGRKILVSGNGRCNFTNLKADALGHYHGASPHFRRVVLNQFRVRDTLQFFTGLGLAYKEEKRGRLFPQGDQAQTVVDLMAAEMDALGVEVCLGTQVVDLQPGEAGGFTVCSADGRQWKSEKTVLATGGVSLEKLGASRWGMDAVGALGHDTTPLSPGLVPLVSPDQAIRRASGVKVWAEVNGKNLDGRAVSDIDDLLLTKYGVSGFTILNLSAQLALPCKLTVNLMPGTSPEKMSQDLSSLWAAHPARTVELSLAGLLHRKVVDVLLKNAVIDPKTPVGSIGKKKRWDLARILTGFPIAVTEARPFEYAEVTIGGVKADAVNPHTLESYLVPGLYLAGEMLEVHGDLGGFNFQWAWASGFIAGQGQ